jgi:tRNA (cytidine/uridine-2'-O-)-methyltransferase
VFNVVLVHPEIPNNTGNIGRLCLGSGAKLHLIKPLGFELDNTRLKRAGLDYWPHLNLCIYENFDAFLKENNSPKMAFLSSHSKKVYTQIPFETDLFLVFGKESSGLDNNLLTSYKNQTYTIPMYSDKIRSLNLANAVGIVLYEGLRQCQSL